MRVAFVTTDIQRVDDEDVDRPHQELAFGRAGIELVHDNWYDPGVDWSANDLVVFRSTWDYSERIDEFRPWLSAMAQDPALSDRIHNPVGLIEWNLDKRYLNELSEQGIATVTTAFVSDPDDAPLILQGHRDSEVVLKPVISAGSRDTGRFRADDPNALELALGVLSNDEILMIQPFIESVATEGELAFILIDGRFSHSLTKGPLLAPGGGFLGGSYTEIVAEYLPADEDLAVVKAAYSAIRAKAHECGWLDHDEELLYARLDFVRLAESTLALLEAELFEPSLFMDIDPSAADRFARACAERIARRDTRHRVG